MTRTAVVTGASSGIGLPSARALAGDGFHVGLATLPAVATGSRRWPTRLAVAPWSATSPTPRPSRPWPPRWSTWTSC